MVSFWISSLAKPVTLRMFTSSVSTAFISFTASVKALATRLIAVDASRNFAMFTSTLPMPMRKLSAFLLALPIASPVAVTLFAPVVPNFWALAVAPERFVLSFSALAAAVPRLLEFTVRLTFRLLFRLFTSPSSCVICAMASSAPWSCTLKTTFSAIYLPPCCLPFDEKVARQRRMRCLCSSSLKTQNDAPASRPFQFSKRSPPLSERGSHSV